MLTISLSNPFTKRDQSCRSVHTTSDEEYETANPISSSCELMEAPALPSHLLFWFVSVILPSLLSLRSSLGLSFTNLWCFYIPLKLILSKPESNNMYFRCLHTIQEPQRCKLPHIHLYFSGLLIAYLANFHPSPECILAFTTCLITCFPQSQDSPLPVAEQRIYYPV